MARLLRNSLTDRLSGFVSVARTGIMIHGRQQDMAETASRRGRRLRTGFPVFLAIAGCLVLGAVSAPAQRVGKMPRPADKDLSYQGEFSRLAEAWRRGDRKALADLVHSDGLVVTPPGAGDRAATYSPSQAFYYFRNLFQNIRTITFTMTRIQDSPRGDRIHGLALWDFKDGGQKRTLRLVLVLARDQDGWRLSEITTIK